MTIQIQGQERHHRARQQQAVATQLVRFVNDELLPQECQGVDGETPLLELGILDSLAMVSLLAFVHAQFGVHIPDEAVIPEHFATLTALARVITNLQAAQPVARPDDSTRSALVEAARLLEASGIARQSIALATGERMHVLRTSGSTPTWVLLPGLGNPASSWGPMLRSLAGEHAAIAIDFAGFGLSCSIQERPTYEAHLRATLALLERLAEPPYVLVGSSAGALLATAVARQHAEQVTALVLVGCGLIDDIAGWWQRLLALSAVPEHFLDATYYRPPRMTDTLRQFIVEVLSRPAYASFLEGHGALAMATAFNNLRVPTLFVAGEHDRIMPPATVRAAAAHVPGAQLVWLARCGHFPPVEQPEELLYVIRNFLGALRQS
jgi:pimeloyl-ACP methyl ester carboxylesterase